MNISDNVREDECLEETAAGGERCVQIPVHCVLPGGGGGVYQEMVCVTPNLS